MKELKVPFYKEQTFCELDQAGFPRRPTDEQQFSVENFAVDLDPSRYHLLERLLDFWQVNIEQIDFRGMSSFEFSNLFSDLSDGISSPQKAYEGMGEVLLGLTEFFREMKSWQQVVRHVLPKLTSQETIRYWSVGATGDEIASIAIMHQCTFGADKPFELLAININPLTLEKAKNWSIEVEEIQGVESEAPQFDNILNRKLVIPIQGTDRVQLPQEIAECITYRVTPLPPEASATQCPHVVFCQNMLYYLQDNARIAILERLIGDKDSQVALVLDGTSSEYMQNWLKDKGLARIRGTSIWRWPTVS